MILGSSWHEGVLESCLNPLKKCCWRLLASIEFNVKDFREVAAIGLNVADLDKSGSDPVDGGRICQNSLEKSLVKLA